jgi:hypothetical protein
VAGSDRDELDRGRRRSWATDARRRRTGDGERQG